MHHAQNVQIVTRATEEDAEKIDFKFHCPDCERNFQCDISLAAHCRLQPPPSSAEQCLSPCPPAGNKILIRELKNLDVLDWRMRTLSKVNNRKRACPSVE